MGELARNGDYERWRKALSSVARLGEELRSPDSGNVQLSMPRVYDLSFHVGQLIHHTVQQPIRFPDTSDGEYRIREVNLDEIHHRTNSNKNRLGVSLGRGWLVLATESMPYSMYERYTCDYDLALYDTYESSSIDSLLRVHWTSEGVISAVRGAEELSDPRLGRDVTPECRNILGVLLSDLSLGVRQNVSSQS